MPAGSTPAQFRAVIFPTVIQERTLLHGCAGLYRHFVRTSLTSGAPDYNRKLTPDMPATFRVFGKLCGNKVAVPRIAT